MGRQNFSSQHSGRGRGRGRGRGGRGRREGGQEGRGNMVNFRGPGYNDGVPKSVDEATVGILRYLSPETTGFSGTIKERYSDFIVREVGLNGEVVRLRDVTRKKDLKKDLKISEIVKKRVLAYLEDKAAIPVLDNESEGFHVNNRVRGLVGKLSGKLLGLYNHNKRMAATAEDRANIGLLQGIVTEVCDVDTAIGLTTYLTKLLDARIIEQANPGTIALESDDVFLFPGITDKENRMKIHQSIRQLCSALVISDTISDAEGVSVIRLRKTHGRDGKKRKDMDTRSNRVDWPSDRPDFLQFVLYKKNMETMSVISQLARAMAVHSSSFTYAGTKDKRGITTQLLTVYHGSMDRLAALNKARRNLDEFNFIVGNATYVTDRLNLGDLRGNQFTMVIRSLPPRTILSDQVLHEAVETWASRGFINYFGLQRFGTRSIATHEVGRAILQRNHKLVIDLIMSPQEGDASKITEARQHFMETHDIEQAIKSFPPYFIAEHSILQGLKTHGLTAYTNAIACIPRHLRMMYTHAYQSYVWNVLASERLQHYSSTDVVLGDLVLPHEALEDVVNDDDTIKVEDVSGESNKKRKLASKTRVDVIVITEANRSMYTIYDVVLPLPGYDITLPQNALQERYRTLLATDGIDFSSLSRATNSEYHLPGSYRPLLRKPLHVSHQIKQYDDATLNLVESDVDHLCGTNAQVSIPNGKYRALCLEFQLSPSSYATMAIRELMKQSSNINVQLQVKEEHDTNIENNS